MNSRERVLATLNHKEPDKVPIDLGSTTVTSITYIAYNGLRNYLGIEPDPEPNISNRQMGTVYPMEDLFQYYEVDFRPVNMKSPWGFKARQMPDDSFYDEFGIRWKKALYYYDMIEHPLAGCTIGDLDKATWPDPFDLGRVEGLQEEVKALYENTDYCIVAGIMCGGPFEQACCQRGFEDFCVDLYYDPKFAEALLDKITQTDLAMWDVYLDEVGDYAQVVCQGDDLGAQKSLYISPEMYRKFIKPCERQIFDLIKARTDAKIFLHTCGSVYDIIGDLIDIGLDILNPVQRSAAKMDIATLKQEFGQDLCFWGGGIDVQQVLPFASPEMIEEDVNRTFEIMAPGGGFVFAPTHNIQPDVTPERIHATYEAALRYRHYDGN